MSSYRKDARWQLALQMIENTPLNQLSDLPYALGQQVLDAAEALLQHFDSPQLDRELAKLFATPEGSKDDTLARLRERLMRPVPPDSFHLNGFDTTLDQLADLYDEEFANDLRAILDPKATSGLEDLPDGSYFDGTYEWEKEGSEWTPIHAPQGMPPTPERSHLKRVTKRYEDI